MKISPFEIIALVTHKQLRPELPPHPPKKYCKLMQESWLDNAEERPDMPTIVKRLEELIEEDEEESKREIQTFVVM